jgi:predicted O-methyltransferase YrrM
MSWQARARERAQSIGLDPRYVRRARWVAKAAAVRRVGAPVLSNLRYVLSDPEPANCTYELGNEDELAAWVADVAGVERAVAAAALAEPRADEELRVRLRKATHGRWLWSKAEPPFGRRAAWYAIARLLAPQLVIETGVHDGLGSLLLLRALERNGGDGRLVAFDINPAAGWIPGPDPRYELRIERAVDGLSTVLASSPPVGLFIHDSLHSYDNERAELELGAARLAPDGVLITDNAHGTRALADVCASHGLRYSEFFERPRGHFHPGGGMGAGVAAPAGAPASIRNSLAAG